MTTVGKLIELLSKYPSDFVITNEQNEDFVHIVNGADNVILSTQKPIGICNRTGSYVYPTQVKGYAGYCPELDEDLYKMEFEKINKD